MLLALALLFGAMPALPPQPSLALKATQQKLDNGMTVIVSPDHSAPGVAVDIWYQVGSRNEDLGRTGFAHLFEHLMFMGARHVPYPQFDTIMEAGGGQNNAFTNSDTTNYYEFGPSNLLETFFWMEADRMASLGATMTQAKLDTQRLVVLNERRQSYENRPYGCADLAVAENLFPTGHPYSWDTIGSPKDLEAATVDDVKHFFATWYVPNNATMTVVGDVDPAQVFQLAKRYFGFLPKKPLPPRLAPSPVRLKEEKRIALTDKVKVPKLVLSWISPAGYAPGDADCDLLGSILAQGKASRLYERLVHKDSLATEVHAGQESYELQGIFQIEVLAQPGRTLGSIQRTVDEEIARLVAEGPSAAEVESARGHHETNLAKSLESFQRRALKLADYAVHLGNPNALNRDLDRYRAVTPATIQAMAQRLFVPGRLVVTVEPAAPAKEGGVQ